MKKSMIYHAAMICVIEDSRLTAETKLEIIEALMADKSLAVFTENRESQNESEKW